MLFRSSSLSSKSNQHASNEDAREYKRVVITGIGIATALGTGWSKNVTGFQEGRSGFRDVTQFPVDRQRCRIAAEMDLPQDISAYCFGDVEESWWSKWGHRSDRASRILMLAVREAYAACGWGFGENNPIILATTSGGMSMGEAYLEHALNQPLKSQGQAQRVLQYQPQRQILDMAEVVGSRGPQWIISNACASGSNAVGIGWRWVRSGRAKRVWTGGYDSVARMTFAGFDSLQALSQERSRPLDVNRQGLGLGEGAAVLALESLTAARERGAKILGEIVGYSACHDIHHLTQPHPEGHAAALSMQGACLAAGVSAEDIDYINAHGTGTPLNDSAEANGIRMWMEDCRKDIYVSSTKSSVGHLLGAAGAVEAAVCCMALSGGWIPPTGSLEAPDPLFDGLSTPSEKVDREIRYALSNSFGFGGANASLVFRKWEEEVLR